MKIFTTFFLTFFSILAFTQIQNEDFENWTIQTYFEDPDIYSTSNAILYFESGILNVTKVNGQTGNAARLETKLDVPGNISLYRLGGPLFGLGPGWSFNDNPDSIKLTVRHDIQAGDTSEIILVMTGGTLIFPYFGTFQIGGTDTNWHNVAFPINMFGTPDSVAFIMTSSSLDTVINGSWIEVDNIEMVNSSDQLPNNGLENWSTLSSEEPDNWFSYNPISVSFNGSLSVEKSTDSYSGSFSAQIKSILSIGGSGIDTVGILVNGDFLDGVYEGGYPYTQQPTRLTGFYKYTPVDNDRPLVYTAFTEYNSSTMENDSINGGTLELIPTTSFTKFALDFDWTGINSPDSVILGFSSSYLLSDKDIKRPGSTLILDDLAFDFSTSIGNVTKYLNGITVYPNPSSEYAVIQFNTENGSGQSITIYNLAGQKLKVQPFEAIAGVNTIQVDVSNFSTGTYTFVISDGVSELSGNFEVVR